MHTFIGTNAMRFPCGIRSDPRMRESACAALAAKWQVDAVGRDYRLHLSRAGPAVAGE